jgi:hypothetical protein
MRSIAVAGLALAAMLSLATAKPAAAWDDGRNYHGTGLYVHHHSYAPPRIRNVYAVHSPGPYHVHVVQFGGYPYVWYNARGGYFGPYASRYWSWQGSTRYRRW